MYRSVALRLVSAVRYDSERGKWCTFFGRGSPGTADFDSVSTYTFRHTPNCGSQFDIPLAFYNFACNENISKSKIGKMCTRRIIIESPDCAQQGVRGVKGGNHTHTHTHTHSRPPLEMRFVLKCVFPITRISSNSVRAPGNEQRTRQETLNYIERNMGKKPPKNV